jgi:hypothetical protein
MRPRRNFSPRTGTHEELSDREYLQFTNRARGRVFSLGLNAVQLPGLLCGGPCNTEGVGHLSLVVQCRVSCEPHTLRHRFLFTSGPASKLSKSHVGHGIDTWG